jgi:hypothetical protein
LVSDFRSRIESGESLDSISADLEYGFDEELEEFARRLRALLTETGETNMVNTRDNGLSTSSQPAKYPSYFISLFSNR